MTPEQLTAVIIAVGGVLAIYFRFRLDQQDRAIKLAEQKQEKTEQKQEATEQKVETNRVDLNTHWKGIVDRGYIEAMTHSHLKPNNGGWIVNPASIPTYRDIQPKLREIRATLRIELGREPNCYEFAWAMQRDTDIETWMLLNACPALKTNQHGCLAIACEIARIESW